MVNPLRLQEINLPRVLERVNDWKIPDTEKENIRKFAKGLYSLSKTKLKFMKGLTPSTIAIGNDRIIIMTWDNKGKFVVIMGKEIAESYKAFFESLWKMSEY